MGHSEGGTLNLISLINPPRFEYFKSILDSHFDDSKTTKMLDIGCGGGMLTNEFGALGYDVTGIDIAKNSLKAAKENAESRGIKTVKYMEGRAEKLEFQDGTFDVILISDVLEHLF